VANHRYRDYSIVGPEKRKAIDKGLQGAGWYLTPIPRKRLKELMQRKDTPGITDTLIWFGLIIVFGFIAYMSWGTWWAIPAFLIYGTIYAAPADSRWHECGHGTAFKSSWLNEVVYQIASFMTLKPATPWRWSHTRHHTDTVIVGLDREIPIRPPLWKRIAADFFKVRGGYKDLRNTFLHVFGILAPDEKEFIPVSEYRKTFWEARIVMAIFIGVIAWSISIESILPLFLIGLPTFYGSMLLVVFVMTQHMGLCEDVLDHRLNSRTVYMNRVFRFFYWNMNYHIEHHMYPLVPYHALPALHEEMKHDCPTASPTVWSAIREVLTALRKQMKDPTYSLVRPLPETANPYFYGPQIHQT
jgi:fatty acid desaturase